MSGGRIAYQNNWVDVVTLREHEMQNLQPNDRFRFNGITNTNNKKGENKEVRSGYLNRELYKIVTHNL